MPRGGVKSALSAALCAAALGLSAPVLAEAPIAAAQAETGLASLIADRVDVSADGVIEARGRVEILFDTYRLIAESVRYDRRMDELTIEGPMRIVSADGMILTAESAQLSSDLENGLLRSARLVLDQHLQLAAAEILRVGGRYSVLDKTVASSCMVCVGNPVPLWQIRASRVIHDSLEQQLFFENARLEVMGLPIIYLPRMRLPDPSLERSTGFLTPKIRATNGLGVGLKLPYFITMGRHADLTLTPYLSSSYTRTLEMRARRAFASGTVEVNAAVSNDDLLPGQTRAYLFAKGQFDLPRDYELTFNIQTVNDPSYLSDYDYSDADRLASDVTISRTRRDEDIAAGLIYYHSLRASESNDTIPSTVGYARWERRLSPDLTGGIASLSAEAFAFDRRSTTDVIGRDLARFSLDADWQRNWTLPNGMLVGLQGAVSLDYYGITDDSTTPDGTLRLAPFVATELRWPMARSGANGATQVIEPVVQLVWSTPDNSDIPNEDSLSTAFDEGNLFSLSRFPGADSYEQGFRANLGVGWTRYAETGWSAGVTVGRILRFDTFNQFSPDSGLSGASSDWLAAVNLTTQGNLSLTNRALFDDDATFTRNDLRVNWANDRLSLGSSYIWQVADLTENRPDPSNEWQMDASYVLTPGWTGKADWRYDFAASRAATAGIGLEYANECVTVDLSLSRRFTSSTSVRPTTDLGLTISLNGVGNGSQGSSYRRSCAR